MNDEMDIEFYYVVLCVQSVRQSKKKRLENDVARIPGIIYSHFWAKYGSFFSHSNSKILRLEKFKAVRPHMSGYRKWHHQYVPPWRHGDCMQIGHSLREKSPPTDWFGRKCKMLLME